ncbi:MAG: hypothetical protein MJA83_03100 [Gammaproteobacteria bacterium]|nr:hypothetical protein [Gammaproteobacteria bacterium]
MQLDRLSQQHLAYSALNGIGAVLILYSLYFDFNLASVIIEFAWLAISILGIYRSIRRAPTDSSR